MTRIAQLAVSASSGSLSKIAWSQTVNLTILLGLPLKHIQIIVSMIIILTLDRQETI